MTDLPGQRPGPSLVQPAVRDARHYAYEAVYRDQINGIDLRPALLYRVHEGDGTPVAPALIHLARQFSLMGPDGWNLAQTDAQRRDLIQHAILLHRTKGTPGGLEEALARAGFPSARVHERVRAYEAGPAARHNGQFRRNGYLRRDARQVPRDRSWATFRVSLDAVDYDRARLSLDDIRAVIESYKRAVCHMTDLSFRVDVPVDTVAVSDVASLAAALPLRGRWWDGPRHDGTLRRSGAARRRHDGRTGRNGGAARDGRPVSSGPAATRNAIAYPQSVALEVGLNLLDRHTIPARRDGALRRGQGIARDGTAPGMRDGGVDLIVIQGGRMLLTAGPYPSIKPPAGAISAGPRASDAQSTSWGASAPVTAAYAGGTY